MTTMKWDHPTTSVYSNIYYPYFMVVHQHRPNVWMATIREADDGSFVKFVGSFETARAAKDQIVAETKNLVKSWIHDNKSS